MTRTTELLNYNFTIEQLAAFAHALPATRRIDYKESVDVNVTRLASWYQISVTLLYTWIAEWLVTYPVIPITNDDICRYITHIHPCYLSVFDANDSVNDNVIALSLRLQIVEGEFAARVRDCRIRDESAIL